LLKFNSDHGYIAGADIGGSRLRMVLADLDGAVLANWSTVLTKAQKTPEAVCALIAEGLRAMCDSIGVSVKKVLHLTAGAPGATRADEGIVIAAPNLAGWTNLPLRAMLQKKLNIPVVVENDTNLAAVGERWRGAADGADDFVFIALGTGFGAGIFINGQLYYGSRWSSGEVGYLGIGGEVRSSLNIHKTGQLESVIGGEGIEIRWRKALQEDGLEKDKDLNKLHSSEIFDLAGDGDQRALKVLQYTAKLVAEAVADITVILDPKIVVLGGGVGSHPQLCQATKALLEKYDYGMPEIRSSALGTQAQLFGSLSVSMTAVEASLIA
jgi:glucokinase